MHPEPPSQCPFFRVHNGELKFSPGAFAVEHDAYSLDQDCFPAKRYAAACVAMGWMLGQQTMPMTVDEYRLYWTLFAGWETFLNAARAEMEASNG